MGRRSFGGRLPQNSGILQCRTLYFHTGLVRTNTGSLLEPPLPALKEGSKRVSAAARTILKFSQCKTLEASPSLRPLAAAYCPKVWFTSPLHYDLGRPSTRQSVLDVLCLHAYHVEYGGTARRPQVSLSNCPNVRFVFQRRHFHC